MKKYFLRIAAILRHAFIGYQIIGTNKKTGKREVVYCYPDYDSAMLVGSFGWRGQEQYSDLTIR